MKILLDEGLSYRAADVLKSAGLDAIHVFDLHLESVADERIIEVARQQKRVVVTLDSDFHALLARSGAIEPSVIRIRMEMTDHVELAALISEVVGSHAAQLEAGAAISVTSMSRRVRRLPLP